MLALNNDSLDPCSSKYSDHIFMPRTLWVPDNKAKSCFSCNSTFLPVIKRRHHCRMCGNVFCTSCSNNFLKPPKFIYENEKEIRVCNHCFTLSQNLIKKLDTCGLHFNFPRTPGSRSNKVRQSYKFGNIDTTLFSLNANLSYHLDSIMDNIIDYIFKAAGVSATWNDALRDHIIRAMDEVQPDTVTDNDSMDISQYIKVKRIPYVDQSETEYIQGLLIRKNTASKKMASEIVHPRIMMISSSLDLDSSQHITNLEQVIEQEREHISSIVRKIMRFKPNIIFIEKTANWTIQEKLREKQIVVVFKLRHSQFKRIARITNSKAISNIMSLEPTEAEKAIGSCSQFQVKRLENLELFEKAKAQEHADKAINFDPTLMKLEGCNPAKGVTIAISGPDYSELKLVKKCMRDCFVNLRNFVIEKEVILQEIFLYFRKDEIKQALNALDSATDPVDELERDVIFKESDNDDDSGLLNMVQGDYKEMFDFGRIKANLTPIRYQNKHLLNRKTITSAGYFINFRTDSKSLEQIINQTTFGYTKVNFVMMNLDDHPDLENLSKQELQQLERNLAARPHQKIDYLVQICSAPKQRVSDCYSTGDISLGDYIKRRAGLLYEKCEYCNRPRYYHTTIFYKDSYYVKAATHLIGPGKEAIILEYKRQNNKKKGSGNTFKPDLTRTSMQLGSRDSSASMKEILSNSSPEEEKSSNAFTNFFGSLFNKKAASRQSMADWKSPSLLNDSLSNSPALSRMSFSFTNTASPQKNTQVEKATTINTYLECNKCKKRASDEFELSKVYLEYSLNRFIEQFIRTNQLYQKEGVDTMQDLEEEPLSPVLQLNVKRKQTNMDSGGKLQLVKSSSGCCMNSTKSRVFRYGEVLIKFTAGPAQVYKVVDMRSTSKYMRFILKSENQKIMSRKLTNCRSQFSAYLAFIIEKLNKFIEVVLEKTKFPPHHEEAHLSIDIPDRKSFTCQDLMVTMFKEIAAIQRKLLELKTSLDDAFSKTMNNHLEVDWLRKVYFTRFLEIFEELRAVRDQFIENGKTCDDATKSAMLPRVNKKEKIPEKKSAEIPNEYLHQNIADKAKGRGGNDSGPGTENDSTTSMNIHESEEKVIHKSPQRKKSQSYSNMSPPQSVKHSFDEVKPVEKKSLTESIAHEIHSPDSYLSGQAAKNLTINVDVSKGVQEPFSGEISSAKLSMHTSSEINKKGMHKRAKDADDEKELEMAQALAQGLVDPDGTFEDFSLKKQLYIPLNDQLSAIAYALSSSTYYKEVHTGFIELEKLANDPTVRLKFLTAIQEKFTVLEEKPLTIKKREEEFLYRGVCGVLSELSNIILANNSRISTREVITLMDIGSRGGSYIEKFVYPKCKISVYYPAHFQALRLLEGINHHDFINSISCSNDWAANSGGKSKASFIRSADNRFVFKSLKKFEFNMLDEMIHQYFAYISRRISYEDEIATRLAKILGMYEVTTPSGGSKYYVAMENIFFGINPTRIYDLKGSEIRRYIPNPKPGQVMLDTNFKLDQNGEPIGIEDKQLKKILSALKGDAFFLADMARIDYSLILAIDDERLECKIGIIDYLREYTLDKQLEHIGKVVMSGTTPTIVHPNDYCRRFIESMEKDFMGIFVEEKTSEKSLEEHKEM